MKYTTLPNTTIKVSKIALGTMTFGEQNSEAEGHSQIDFALDRGINFIDTAEMYSVPAREETYGSTEKIIGTWFKKSGKRDEVILATKIAGPNPLLTHIRGKNDFSPKSIHEALDKSLHRLQTDYIDLYQLHWPERKTNTFGQRGFKIIDDGWQDNILEVLTTLQGLISSGKIRAIGISNETPWGVMRFLDESKQHNLPRIATIQNPYSLLNRSFEVGLSEICYRENIGLLAYSPLAFGVLSGKFLTGEHHPNARINLYPKFARYNSDTTRLASKRYSELAQDFGLTLTEMALAFIESQSFCTSAIIGATNLQQLAENCKTIEVTLSAEIIEEIEKIQALFPNPAP